MIKLLPKKPRGVIRSKQQVLIFIVFLAMLFCACNKEPNEKIVFKVTLEGVFPKTYGVFEKLLEDVNMGQSRFPEMNLTIDSVPPDKYMVSSPYTVIGPLVTIERASENYSYWRFSTNRTNFMELWMMPECEKYGFDLTELKSIFDAYSLESLYGLNYEDIDCILKYITNKWVAIDKVNIYIMRTVGGVECGYIGDSGVERNSDTLRLKLDLINKTICSVYFNSWNIKNSGDFGDEKRNDLLFMPVVDSFRGADYLFNNDRNIRLHSSEVELYRKLKTQKSADDANLRAIRLTTKQIIDFYENERIGLIEQITVNNKNIELTVFNEGDSMYFKVRVE